MFEKEKKSLDLIRKLKLKIGRVQVSSAIKIMDLNKTNMIYLDFLKKSPFLHQSLIIKKNLKIDKQNDFKNINIDAYDLIKEIRIHCHVPIYIKKISNGIYTTQDELIESLSNIIKYNYTKNLEIETYTYNVIYNKKYNKIKSMIKEFNWLINLIKKIYDKTF
ncbi:MAG TPA: hypothetical protein ACYCDB_00170 [Candidatus Azoamicus sp.]